MKNQYIYLDNVSTMFPKPKLVLDYMQDSLSIYGSPGRGSHAFAKLANDYVHQVRTKLAQIFNVPYPEHVIFTQSATHGLNTIIKGYFNYGDHALVCHYSHNAVLRPLAKLKHRGVIDYDIFDISESGDIDEVQISKLIKTNTRIIICNHASNVTGTYLKIDQVSKIAKNYGLHILLDCTQSALYKDIDVVHDGIDFLVGAGHKSFMGPSGVGFMYIKDETLIDQLMDGGSDGNSSISPVHPQFLPYKFETGTMNFIGIAGLNGALDHISAVGIAHIRKQVKSLTDYAIHDLSQIKQLQIYSPATIANRAPIISINLNGLNPSIVAHLLDLRFGICVRSGIHCAPLIHKTLNTIPEGTLRISFSHVNTIEEILQLIYAIQSIISEEIVCKN